MAALSMWQDYTVQSVRFEVEEVFGCADAADDSVLRILLLNSWSVTAPLVSIIFYYRKLQPVNETVSRPDARHPSSSCGGANSVSAAPASS